nr:unnamed protein product [Callosobruchus analis]
MTMSLKRFEILPSFMRFDNSMDRKVRKQSDKTAAILLSSINENVLLWMEFFFLSEATVNSVFICQTNLPNLGPNNMSGRRNYLEWIYFIRNVRFIAQIAEQHAGLWHSSTYVYKRFILYLYFRKAELIFCYTFVKDQRKRR